jgi:putative thioredoxin
VRSLPSCILFRHGREVEHLRGMQTEADYRALIDRHAAVLADRVQVAALALWQSGDRERAIRVLAEGAMAEPERPQLPLLMAKLLTQDGRAADAFAVLDTLPGPLKSLPEIARLHIHLGFLAQAESAPPETELLAALEAQPDRLDLRLALAARRLVADDYQGAMDQLAEIHRLDPGFGDGIGRRGLLAVFAHLAADDPRVAAYRRLLFQH